MKASILHSFLVAFFLLLIVLLSNSNPSYSKCKSERDAGTKIKVDKQDSISQAHHDDFNIRVEKSEIFLDFISQYINYTNHPAQRKVDSTLCREIVRYYSFPNPLDGGPAEVQAGTIYEIFSKNDSLCIMIDKCMNIDQIAKQLQDTIWYRIAFDIMGMIWMEEWDENEQKQKFDFIYQRGYFCDDYSPYIDNH